MISGEEAAVVRAVVRALVAQRLAAGLSQAQVAHRMGVSQSTISGFESETVDPRISTLQRYARAVGSEFWLAAIPAPPADQPPGDTP